MNKKLHAEINVRQTFLTNFKLKKSGSSWLHGKIFS